MSTKVGSLEIELAANIARLKKDFADAKAEVTKAVNGITGEVKKMQAEIESSMNSIQKSIKIITASVTAFYGFKAVIDVASSFEQLEIRLNAVMGSSKEAERAMAWIKQFAQNTPYSVQQTTDAFMQLKNFGLDPMDGTLQKVSDASAKYGKGADTAQRVTLALGQAWARGKLQGQDTLQMIDAGIPVYDLLAKATGKTAAEIQVMSEKGEMGRDVLRKLIDQMGVEGAGAAAAKMNSYAGAISNMGDAFENAIDKVRKDGGFLPLTQSVLEFTKILPTLVDVAVSAFSAIGAVFKLLAETARDVFTDIARILDSVWGSSSKSMSGLELFTNMLKVVQVAIISLRVGFETVFGLIGAILNQTIEQAIGFASALNKLLQLDFSGAASAWQDGMTKSRAVFQAGMDKIVLAAQKGRDDINNALADAGQAKKIEDNQPGALGNPTGKKSAKADKSQMGDFKSELEGQHDRDNTQTLAQDEAFWMAKLEQVKRGSADEKAVMHEIFTLRKTMLKQQMADDAAAFKEQQKLDDLKIDRARDAALAQLDSQREQLTLAKSLGQIDDQQEIAALQKLEQQKYQIEAKAAQDKIALEGLAGVAKQQQLDELAKLEEKHNLELEKLHNKSVLAVQKDWNDALKGINGAFEQSLNGMMMGTQTFQKSMQNIGQAITAEFVKMGVKRVTAWVSSEKAMEFASKAKQIVVTAMEKIGATTAMATKGVEATTIVGANAAEGATGAAAAVAPIPIVGPGMAIAAFAAVMATLLGARSMIKSSAGGDWRIPSDRLNFVHAQETILPADKSRGLDELISQGTSGGMTVNIHAVDARSVRNLFNDHGDALMKALQQQMRNGARFA